MTTAQVAEMTGLKKHTIAEYCNAGIITANKVGRDWYILRKDAREFKAKHRPVGNPNWV